ncbi:MAG: YcaO-like family protein [Candidatus Woesearchaeota archaeon]|jgi:ribosomal protein S12 methylthiotransferase accessory factor|nr:YcaO-like family protein [Candidatus Woesearchaeota archaeon]
MKESLESKYVDFKFDSIKKEYDLDQDKAIHPKETYEFVFNRLNKVYPQTEYKLTKLSEGNFCVFSFGDEKQTAYGKGATLDQAKASAIMEYIERFSWINFNYKNNNSRQISFEDLSKEINLDSIEPVLNIEYSKKKEELKKLIKKIPLDWIPSYNIIKEEPSYYPINYNNAYQTSNGLASGNTKEETIMQALCELIERQNLDIFIKNFEKSKIELIEIENINNEVLTDLLKNIKKNNIDIYIINATMDIEVSTIIACGINKNKNEIDYGYIGYGYGTHANPIKAIIRAITEYIQMSAMAEKDTHSSFGIGGINKTGNWQYVLNIDIKKKLIDAKKSSHRFLPDYSRDNFKDELDEFKKIFEERNIDVFIIDKTHHLLKIPVYRLMIPKFSPGTIFSSINENDDLLMAKLYFQAGLFDEAKRYYEENFEDMFFTNTKAELEIFFQTYPHITEEMLRVSMNPQSLPIEAFLRPDYIKQQRFDIFKKDI